MITEKIWGITQDLLRSSFIEIHRLHVEPRSRCSMHKHAFKWNAFFVEEGEIEIEKEEGDLITRTVLSKGNFLTVEPNIYHRFLTGDLPAVVLEIYYPEPLSEDIFRRDHGSRDLGA